MSLFGFVIIILALFFSIPLMAIYTEHRRKLMELQLRAQSGTNERVEARLLELTREIADLRATTTEFDLSFDAALERAQERMENIERRLRQLEELQHGMAGDTTQESHQTVR